MSSSSDQSNIPVSALYSKALKAASKASSLPTIQDETQEIIQESLSDLHLLASKLQDLHVFSANESLEDVSTRNLIYMTLPFIMAEVLMNARTLDQDERKKNLKQAQMFYRAFDALLDDYGVILDQDKRLHQRRASKITDPSKRREVKIAQFKNEVSLKNDIQALRAKRSLPEIDYTNTFDLVDSIVTVGKALHSQHSEDDDVDDELERFIRKCTLLLIRLQWAQAATQMDSIDQELELLYMAPEEDRRFGSRVPEDEDRTWRLDFVNRPINASGPLLDSSGRPLRPFTILPSSAAAERDRIQAEVFRPDHRLPTMTIDQYLEEERRRGNIISGGGPQSQTGLTKKELLALAAEMDGTFEGEEKADEKRDEDERWARFTDANPRGSGNTMNRG